MLNGDLQLGITQGRNLKKLSFLERVCVQPGSHSHAKPKVPFEEALQVPFPQLTSLHTFSVPNKKQTQKISKITITIESFPRPKSKNQTETQIKNTPLDKN